jgi:hypothetical protein
MRFATDAWISTIVAAEEHKRLVVLMTVQACTLLFFLLAEYNFLAQVWLFFCIILHNHLNNDLAFHRI